MALQTLTVRTPQDEQTHFATPDHLQTVTLTHPAHILLSEADGSAPPHIAFLRQGNDLLLTEEGNALFLLENYYTRLPVLQGIGDDGRRYGYFPDQPAPAADPGYDPYLYAATPVTGKTAAAAVIGTIGIITAVIAIVRHQRDDHPATTDETSAVAREQNAAPFAEDPPLPAAEYHTAEWLPAASAENPAATAADELKHHGIDLYG